MVFVLYVMMILLPGVQFAEQGRVHWTIDSVHCTIYSVLCPSFSIHCTIYIVCCTLHSTFSTIYSEHCVIPSTVVWEGSRLFIPLPILWSAGSVTD